MYVMPSDDAESDLHRWFLELRLVISRASYIKQEEALAKEPDSRVLNFVDECTVQPELSLSHGELGLEAAVCLGSVLPFSPNITSIELVDAGVDDLQLSQIVRPLGAGVKLLKTLALRGNVLEADGAKHLATVLAARTTPLTLSLAENNLGDGGCQYIAKLLAGSLLIELDLSGNSIGADGSETLSGALASNTSVTKFEISNNPLLAAGCNHIASMLRKNTAITVLGLASCGITDHCTQSLSDGLCSNSTLVELDV